MGADAGSTLTLMQVKVIEGLGTTMDVVLVNGLLKEGAQIVVCGLGAPIVTTIRSLLTPHPMKVRHMPRPVVCDGPDRHLAAEHALILSNWRSNRCKHRWNLRNIHASTSLHVNSRRAYFICRIHARTYTPQCRSCG